MIKSKSLSVSTDFIVEVYGKIDRQFRWISFDMSCALKEEELCATESFLPRNHKHRRTHARTRNKQACVPASSCESTACNSAINLHTGIDLLSSQKVFYFQTSTTCSFAPLRDKYSEGHSRRLWIKIKQRSQTPRVRFRRRRFSWSCWTSCVSDSMSCCTHPRDTLQHESSDMAKYNTACVCQHATPGISPHRF